MEQSDIWTGSSPFWSAQPEVDRIWFSAYTPQRGKVSDEMLSPVQRLRLAGDLTALASRYPKLMLPEGRPGPLPRRRRIQGNACFPACP